MDERQAYLVPDALPFAMAAFAKPLAVALHAVGRAGPLLGRAMLIAF